MSTFLVAAAAAAALVGLVTAVLPRLGVMDVPNHRSSHARPVPRGGGLVVPPVLAIAVTASQAWTPAAVCIVAGAVALGALGLLDDVRDVPAPTRLALQLLLSLVVGTAVVVTSTDVTATVVLACGAVSSLWLAGYVNVVNFMDGANGVAALHTIVGAGWYAYLGSSEGVPTLQAVGLALLGAALGFLPWNFPRARVFLGDAGSYSIGFALGALAIVTLVATSSPVLAVAPLLVFLADTTTTLVRRAWAGSPVMTAHREHVYQRLTSVHGSARPAVATAVASAGCVAAAATTDGAVCVVIWSCILGAYLTLPRRAGRPAAASPRR